MHLHKIPCPDHPEVLYDPLHEKCPVCEEEKVQEVLDTLDGKEEMVWE